MNMRDDSVTTPTSDATADAYGGRRRIAYREWLFGVFGWDGALPAAVFLVPVVAKQLFPNRPGVICAACCLPCTPGEGVGWHA